MPERIFLIDLPTSGHYVNAAFSVTNCQLGSTKAGKPFLKGVLGDKTGRAPMRMWSVTEEQFNALPTDGFVWVEGNTQAYQGELQIIVNVITPYEPTPRELQDLLPSTSENINAMFAEVMGFLQSLEHPAVKALADQYLQDGELMDLFCQAPAAQVLHHAYLGGLLEHTRNMMRLADVTCPLYPELSRDIVMMGVFLHDLGKCFELSWLNGFQYTTDGNLTGHIVRGALMLDQKVRACANAETPVEIPEPIVLSLQHIILSHHGQPEYGAAKVPSTPEALLVHHLDNIDAKMNVAIAECRSASKKEELGSEFTEKIWSLGTRLYRPDPTGA